MLLLSILGGRPFWERMETGYTTVSPDSEIRSRGMGKGIGFTNIRKCTDSFEVETELGCGTTIRFEVNLSAS